MSTLKIKFHTYQSRGQLFEMIVVLCITLLNFCWQCETIQANGANFRIAGRCNNLILKGGLLSNTFHFYELFSLLLSVIT